MWLRKLFARKKLKIDTSNIFLILRVSIEIAVLRSGLEY